MKKMKMQKPRFTDPRLGAAAVALSRIPPAARMEAARAQADAAGLDASYWDELMNPTYGLTLSGDTLVMDGPIHMGAFARLRELMNELDSDAEMRFDIHSPGGDAVEAVAMLNMLLEDGRVRETRVIGEAFSAASYLFLAADERTMGLGTTVGIHDAWGICIGNAKEMRETSAMLDTISRSIAAIYAHICGGQASEWRALMAATTMLDAKEAVDLGMATSMAEGAAAADDAEAPEAADPDMEAAEQVSNSVLLTYGMA